MKASSRLKYDKELSFQKSDAYVWREKSTRENEEHMDSGAG